MSYKDLEFGTLESQNCQKSTEGPELDGVYLQQSCACTSINESNQALNEGKCVLCVADQKVFESI
jgi:hypothetical protein